MLGSASGAGGLQPPPVRRAPMAMVAAADHLAAEAGSHVLRRGGTAADAAVAANAVMAVTSPHLCGMGGDLFAVVHDGAGGVHALVAAGRAGSGADAGQLRAEGHRRMPFADDIRVTPVPGCVDGWMALHGRFGRLPLAEVLHPAIALAEDGFPASPGLAGSVPALAGREWAVDLAAATRPGALVRRPGLARSLRAIAAHGRSGFYQGEFGAGLLRLGPDEFTAADLERDQAAWVEPLALDAWGVRLWTAPPPASGYLVLAGAAVASGLDLPADPDDPRWAHLLVEAARVVGHDRPAVLHEHAHGATLLDPTDLGRRRDWIDPAVAGRLPMAAAPGDTTYLCAVDGERSGVSLIQSNAGGFGSGLGEPATGIGLQNRGLGFSLEPGHPAEYGPGRRPPSTLAPVLLTGPDGRLRATLGTMGGDAQPQVLLQLLARLLAGGEAPGPAIAAARFALCPRVPGAGAGFATWDEGGPVAVEIEGHAPPGWAEGLHARGHVVRATPAFARQLGHAQAIVVRPDGVLEGAADPRHEVSGAVGW